VDTQQAAGDILFAPVEPYRRDWLAVDGGHRIYHEESGNPGGVPVLFIHGGPGSQTRPIHRRFFDPAAFRIVLFDQRGCGQSTPPGSIDHNTTAHLVADIENLRRHLGVRQWVLFGGSWGSTLSLAYAIEHPEKVAGLVLRGVFLGSQAEVDWYLHGMRRFVPEAWAELAAGAKGPLVEHYRSLIDDPGQSLAAARRWSDYETRLMSPGTAVAGGEASSPAELLGRVRVQLHYLTNGCFLRPGELLDNLWRMKDLPTIIVQGRMDMVCPPLAAVEVASRLRDVELRLVPGAGHAATEPAIAAELRAAASRILARVDRIAT
jgi:proline iminopeptidase